MNNHFYNKELKSKARELRKQGVSIAERVIWNHVLRKNKQDLIPPPEGNW